MKPIQFLLCLLALFLVCLTACDNPVQTEQTLDDWNSCLLSNNLGILGPLACSPDGETIAINREKNFTLFLTYDLLGPYNTSTAADTFYILETPSRNDIQNLTISPNAEYISYTSYDNSPVYGYSTKELVIVNIVTDEKNIYQSDNGYRSYFQWSGDASRLYYLNGSYQFESLNPVTGQVTELGIDVDYFVSDFILNPEKETVLFGGNLRLGDTVYHTLIETDLNSGVQRTLIDTTRNGMQGLSLSFDGRWLAFVEIDSLNMHTIKLLDVESGEITATQLQMIDITDLRWTSDNQTLLFWAKPGEWSYSTQGYYFYSRTGNHTEFLYHYSNNHGYKILGDQNKYYTMRSNKFNMISTITLDSTVTDYTTSFSTTPYLLNWGNNGDIMYVNRGLYRVNGPDEKAERVLPELNIHYDFDISGNGQYLAYRSSGATWVYDLINNQNIVSIDSKIYPSWSPDGTKLACYDFYVDSLYVYEKKGKELVRERACYVEGVYDVDWASTEIASDMRIICCVQVNGRYAYNDEYQLVLIDEMLEEQCIVACSYAKIYACWMANGLDVAYVEDGNELKVKRVVSDF